jgi:CspA family cold shock protein
MGRNALAPGIISRLEKSKGFGFIKCAGGYELYFHQSQVQGTTFASLVQGQGAVFKIGSNQKGLQAIEVKPVTKNSNNKSNGRNSPGKKGFASGTEAFKVSKTGEQSRKARGAPIRK